MRALYAAVAALLLSPAIANAACGPEAAAAPTRLSAAPGREDVPIAEFTIVLKKNPEDRDARHRRAARYASLGRLPEARADYEILRKDPTDGLAAYGLAVVLARLPDWNALEECLAVTPQTIQSARAEDYAKLWHNLGVARDGARDFPKARAAYGKSLELAPGRHATRLALASVELGADDTDAAEKHLDAVTGTLPDELRQQLADLAAALAARRLKKGDLDTAEKLMARAERESPEPFSFVVRFNRALLVWQKGEIPAARTLALALADGDVPADHRGMVTALLYNIARSERLANDLAAAEADLRKALSLSPNDTPSLLLLAKILLVAGRHVDAATTARKCIHVDAAQDECRIAYADAFVGAMRILGPQADAAQARGAIGEAVLLVKKALEIDPDDEILKIRLATLDKEQAEISRFRTEIDKSLGAKNWDSAMSGLLELYRRVPEDQSLATLEASIQTGIIGDRLAQQRRAEDAERGSRLYEAADAWKKVAALDPNDDEVAAKVTAADAAWKKALAEDREAAKEMGSKKEYAVARMLLAKWTDQGLKDDAVKKQLEGFERIVMKQAEPIKASAEKKTSAKKWTEAKAEYETVLKIDPKDKSAQSGKARADGHLDAALGAKLGRELYSQGVVLYSRGAYGEAIDKWSEILELPGAGEWTDRAKSHIARAQRILEMMKTTPRASP